MISRLILYIPTVVAFFYTYTLLTLALVAASSNLAPNYRQLLIPMLWGYLGLAVWTLYTMIVFRFRHCCIGLQTFHEHLRHVGQDNGVIKYWLLTLVEAIIWPYVWVIQTHWLLQDWEIDWGMITFEPTVEWIRTILHGTSTEITRIYSPQDYDYPN